ncbi:MAG: M1 family aminopeptidase [Candidatus Thiodiazotropha sp.]
MFKTKKPCIGCILPLLLWFCSPSFSAEFLHLALQTRLQPQESRLQVTADITLAPDSSPDFLLHSGLDPMSPTPGVEIIEKGPVDGPVPLTAYRIQLPSASHRFSLSYAGPISHPLSRLKESPGRSSERLAGTISAQGIHLDGNTGWYPRFADELQTFTLDVDLPSGWLAVSQGMGPMLAEQEGRQQVRWQASQLQDEIYLIAAPFQLYRQPVDGIEAQVFLRQSDPALASRYLNATEEYLRLYQQLIGPYPYAKFALVENFWQTGYGMPSFTLLGSQVIRLPFILHTSYPHEILHNWWGNSVYVDYAKGNWSEGLTSYLADHLLAEQGGRGSDYRRSALQRYSDFVRHDNDFPLSDFRSRHSTASQAVGYGKSLMLFHMLRRQLGDEVFIAGLRRFYRDNLFRSAGFSDLQQAFEAVSARSLGDFFSQWVTRTGAPQLTLETPRVEQISTGYAVSGQLRQTQSSRPFHLSVPILLQLADGTSHIESIEMDNDQQPFRIEVAAPVLSLVVDPWFDLFRSLDSAETPPSLSQVFGAEQIKIILPATADKALLAGYRTLAETWARDYRQAEILLDNQIEELPKELPSIILGWENRFAPNFLDQLSDYPFAQTGETISLWNESFDTDHHSFALTARSPDSPTPRLWIATHSGESLPGLTRKLPHYGKYSVLAFAGDAPDNRLKRQWPITGSPLQHFFSPTHPLLPAEPDPLVPK